MLYVKSAQRATNLHDCQIVVIPFITFAFLYANYELHKGEYKALFNESYILLANWVKYD